MGEGYDESNSYSSCQKSIVWISLLIFFELLYQLRITLFTNSILALILFTKIIISLEELFFHKTRKKLLKLKRLQNVVFLITFTLS